MIDFSFPMEELEYFLLVFTRITCFIHTAPFYGMNNTPRQVKIGLGFFVSVLLYYALMPHEAVIYTSVLGYAAIIIKEAVTGLLIGLGANICMSIVGFAGRIVDMEIGLSMMSQFDPTTRESLSITGIYYQYTTLLMLLVSGLHRYLMNALAQTYQLIPVNGFVFQGPKLLNAMTTFMRDYIMIGFQICLPIFIVATLMNVILGVLAKIAPQMNMFSVGIQIKILVGIIILFLTVGMLPAMSDMVYTQIKKTIVLFVESMAYVGI